MELEIEIDGVKKRITDVSPYRDTCRQIEAELKRIFAGFDPARSDRLLPHEPQLVEYYNRYFTAADIVARWEEAERSRQNILDVWKLYREIDDAKVGS